MADKRMFAGVDCGSCVYKEEVGKNYIYCQYKKKKYVWGQSISECEDKKNE